VRLFRRSTTRSWLGLLCTFLLVTQTFVSVLAPLPAAAQSGTIEVAVVDFLNNSKVPNEMFSTMARDAVVVELLRSGKFTSTKADDIDSTLEGLGYKKKGAKTILTPAMMQRLGSELGVASVVSGEIVSIKVDSGKKRADVRLAVRMLDVASGEWVNGAAATGTSNPRVGYTGDSETDWIIEAINNAARSAVETMVQYIIPEAAIIGTYPNNRVLLNKGSQDGIVPGMEMIVFRRGDAGTDEVVGRIRVSKVTGTDAEAFVVHSVRGVKPEDRVRAVYELPKVTEDGGVQAPRTDSKQRIAKGTKLLWTALAIAGLFTLLKPGKDTPEEVPGGQVASFALPAEFGSRWSDAGILLLWNNPRDVRFADIIEYHIWRDDSGRLGSGNTSTNVGPVLNPDQISAPPISCALGSYDHFTVDDIVSRSFDYRFPSNDHTSLESGSCQITGITPGKLHHYYISCVYRRQPTSADGDATYWETTPKYMGCATSFQQRPRTVSPGDTEGTEYVDLSDITFEWEGCRGADQYVIEVSTTPAFARDQTWVGVIKQPTSQDGVTISRTFRDILSNSSELRNALPGQRLYWRIGARSSYDKPGPYPAGPSPQVSGEKNTRYIYSDPNELLSFQVLGGVPEPPGL